MLELFFGVEEKNQLSPAGIEPQTTKIHLPLVIILLSFFSFSFLFSFSLFLKPLTLYKQELQRYLCATSWMALTNMTLRKVNFEGVLLFSMKDSDGQQVSKKRVQFHCREVLNFDAPRCTETGRPSFFWFPLIECWQELGEFTNRCFLCQRCDPEIGNLEKIRNVVEFCCSFITPSWSSALEPLSTDIATYSSSAVCWMPGLMQLGSLSFEDKFWERVVLPRFFLC